VSFVLYGSFNRANRQHAALPEAFWADGLDIGNRAVPGRLGRPAVSPGDTMRG
jgi:hypothetical protein